MLLHAAAHPAVLPPVETQYQQYQQYAEDDQPNLQITHLKIPRRQRRLHIEVISGFSGHLHGRINIDGNDTRNPLLLHGNADQLLGHLHGDLVVRDEQELGLLAHAAHKIGIALGIGVIQRRVHFVQQAKGQG